MSRAMGFDFGLGSRDNCFKRKFRWLFKIDGISAEGVKSLPPQKSARPSLSFKTMEVQHLNETIQLPSKTDWKPINLVLYDLKRNKNPVTEWLKIIYDPNDSTGKGTWRPVGTSFRKTATLELYDGCGNVLETWVYENAWPESVEFGDLDMGNNDAVTIDITLRYDRAYVI